MQTSETPPINDAEIVTVRPDIEVMTRQRLPYFIGISGQTVGATGLSMHLVVIPPGTTAAPHFHQSFETAIYILEGQVETRYGKSLEKSIINQAGDFLFIPPGVPHTATNLSQVEPARAIVARNDPNEQENVVPYPVYSSPG
ncbi:MAG: cupin domain-containing protein [Synechococcales bacterium]|nr:cupin domain-containing protein [Synechococcales bacterium]